MKTIKITVRDATLMVVIKGQVIKIRDIESSHLVIGFNVDNEKVADVLYNQWSDSYNQMIYLLQDYLTLVQIMAHQVSALNEYARVKADETKELPKWSPEMNHK